jgi:hypothetical protein
LTQLEVVAGLPPDVEEPMEEPVENEGLELEDDDVLDPS